MNYYNYNNSQFGGWGNGNYANTQMNGFNSLFEKQENIKNDKKILKKIGFSVGLAIIAYIFLANLSSIVIFSISEIYPNILLIATDNIAKSAYSILASVFFIGLPFLIVHRVLKRKRITGNLPFGTTYNAKASINLVMFMFPITIFSAIAVNIVSFLIQAILGVSFTSGLENETSIGVAETLISAVATAIVPAIIEEFVIRGVVMQPLRRYGDWFAIISAALIFSLMHGNMIQIPYTFVSGIYLGYVAIATGSLWAPILLHFLNNFTSVLIIAYTSNLGEVGSTVATVLTYFAVVVCGVIGGINFFKMRYKTKMAKGVQTLKTTEKIKAMFVNVPMIIAFVMLFITALGSISSL